MTKKVLTEVGISELLDEIEGRFRRTLQDVMKPVNTGTKKSQKRYLSRAEACELLGGISYPTLYRRIADGTIVCLKSGKRSLFDEDQLKESLITLQSKGGKHGF